jgi:hypothetical protein
MARSIPNDLGCGILLCPRNKWETWQDASAIEEKKERVALGLRLEDHLGLQSPRVMTAVSARVLSPMRLRRVAGYRQPAMHVLDQQHVSMPQQSPAPGLWSHLTTLHQGANENCIGCRTRLPSKTRRRRELPCHPQIRWSVPHRDRGSPQMKKCLQPRQGPARQALLLAHASESSFPICSMSPRMDLRANRTLGLQTI